jgi:dTDP-4-dehydrorhamnose reductase
MAEPTEKKQKTEKYLIYGAKTGWIGGYVVRICEEKGLDYAISDCRIEDRNLVEDELDRVKPTHVLMAAGLTGRPTVDWCEDHKQEVIRVNVVGVLSIVDSCYKRGIHVTNFATGCIFKYDENHPIGGAGFTECDTPNFGGSFYSHTKAMVENLLQNYDNCLVLRIRMPISADLLHRNFVTKILNYAKVVDIPNSMTTLDDLIPIAIEAAQRKITGILNLCNPGAISHNEILAMYRDYIDPRFKWTNFTEDECNAILKAQRSNNTLDHAKLVSLFPQVPEIHEACKKAFIKMRATLDAEGQDALTAQGWKFPTHHLK